jgi:malonate transporter and related proteins
MLAILEIVTPVFGIILIGWLAARFGYVAAAVGKATAEFAFKVAMPALLFRAMQSIGAMPGSPLKLVAAYLATVTVIWLLASLATKLLLRRPQADAAVIAMAASFGNTVMLGIPLAISAFGPDAAAPMALLVSLDGPVLWIIGTLHIESALRHQTRDQMGGAVRRKSAAAAINAILLDLLRNPIILSLLIGSLWRVAALPVPPLADRLLALLAQGAVPSALFALGMGLATYEIRGQNATLATITLLKLFVFPAIAWAMAVTVFDLPKLWVAIILLFTAMPVGANPFLFATRYERGIGSISASIAVSTAIAVVTISVLLYYLKATL